MPINSPGIEISEEPSKSTKLIPIFESAIRNNSASFAHVAAAHFFGKEKFNIRESSRQAHENYYTELMKAFEAAHGKIVSYYWCSEIVAGAVLTDKDEMFVVNPTRLSGTLEIESLLFACQRLQIEFHPLLSSRDRRVFVEMLYAIVGSLLSLLEAEEVLKKSTPQATGITADSLRPLTLLQEEFKRVELYGKRSAQRNALFNYFGGMIAGVPSIILIGLIIYKEASLEVAISTPEHLLVSLIAGSLGSLVSVMSRMASWGLVLNYEAGWWYLRLLGFCRAFIGALFGVICYTLLSGGFLPFVTVPDDAEAQLYFYAGIGWVAGFSERWAQDMLLQTGDRLIASRDPEQDHNGTSSESNVESQKQKTPQSSS